MRVRILNRMLDGAAIATRSGPGRIAIRAGDGRLNYTLHDDGSRSEREAADYLRSKMVSVDLRPPAQRP